MPHSTMTKMLPGLDIGDTVENVIPMYVREAEEVDSAVVITLAEKTRMVVLEVGERPTRVMISAGDITGWITTATDLDQPLTVKISSTPEQLCEAVVKMYVRAEEDYRSEVLATMDIGDQFELIESGIDKNRCKILFEGTIGWIYTKTDQDQMLIKHLNTNASAKGVKALDTQILKAATTLTKGLSMAFSTRPEVRGMTSTRSNRSKRNQVMDPVVSKYTSEPQEGTSCCTRLCGSRGI